MAKKYDASSIKVLEGLEAVRVRPGMYIGSTGPRGLHHLIWEVLDNSIDEALGGYAKNISVELTSDGYITVTDDGRGIPVDNHSDGKSTLEVIMTKLHAGGKFDTNNYSFSGGLHGVGVSVVNALSKMVIARVFRNGKIYEQRFSKGEPISKLEVIGKSTKTGTQISFLPDDTIFETVIFNPKTIEERLEELSYLNKGLKLSFIEKGKTKLFYSKNGLIDMIKKIESKPSFKPVIIEDAGVISDGTRAMVDIVISYGNSSSEVSFVNNIRTVDGGTHVSGFRNGFTKIVNIVAREKGYIKPKEPNFTGNDIREGLSFIISLKLQDPQFESQTKEKLGTVAAGAYIDNVITSKFGDILRSDDDILKAIVSKAKLSLKARNAAKAAREAVLNKGGNAIDNILPGKLANCISKKPHECELYLVEG